MTDAEDAQTLLERARQAVAEGRLGDAVAGFEEVVGQFGGTTDPGVERLVGDALYAKGHALEGLEREQDALAVYEQMAARFADDEQSQGQLARALLQKGIVLTRLERPEEALAAFDDLIARFGDAREPPLAIGLVSALERKAAAMRRVDQLDDAMRAYDSIVVRFTDSRFPVLRRLADSALSNKVFILLLQGRHDEAIVVADAAVARLDSDGDPDALAIAVLNLGGALVREQRFEEALTVLDTLVERLDDATPELRGHLILAVTNKVETLAMLGRGDEAVAIHRELLERFGDEVVKAFADAAARNEHDEGAAPVVAGMLLKEALVLAELDRGDEARIVAEDLIRRFEGKSGPDVERVVEIAREFRDQLVDGEDD